MKCPALDEREAQANWSRLAGGNPNQNNGASPALAATVAKENEPGEGLAGGRGDVPATYTPDGNGSRPSLLDNRARLPSGERHGVEDGSAVECWKVQHSIAVAGSGSELAGLADDGGAINCVSGHQQTGGQKSGHHSTDRHPQAVLNPVPKLPQTILHINRLRLNHSGRLPQQLFIPIDKRSRIRPEKALHYHQIIRLQLPKLYHLKRAIYP